MTGMQTDMRLIRLHQLGHIFDHEHILSILLLGRFGEVKGARDDRCRVDDHHLRVGNSMLVVDERLDAKLLIRKPDGLYSG